jgi:hypothetical protein
MSLITHGESLSEFALCALHYLLRRGGTLPTINLNRLSVVSLVTFLIVCSSLHLSWCIGEILTGGDWLAPELNYSTVHIDTIMDTLVNVALINLMISFVCYTLLPLRWVPALCVFLLAAVGQIVLLITTIACSAYTNNAHESTFLLLWVAVAWILFFMLALYCSIKQIVKQQKPAFFEESLLCIALWCSAFLALSPTQELIYRFNSVAIIHQNRWETPGQSNPFSYSWNYYSEQVAYAVEHLPAAFAERNGLQSGIKHPTKVDRFSDLRKRLYSMKTSLQDRPWYTYTVAAHAANETLSKLSFCRETPGTCKRNPSRLANRDHKNSPKTPVTF